MTNPVTSAQQGIENIRRSRGRTAQTPLSLRPAIYPARQPEATDAEHFLDEVRKLSGVAQKLTPESVSDALKALIAENGIRKATLWHTPFFEQLGIESILRSLGVDLVSPTADKHEMALCDLGITEADYLLPETGMEELLAAMQALAREHPRKQAVQFLTGYFPRVLSSALLEKVGIAQDALSADIPKAAMQRLAALVKTFTVEPELPAPRNEAMSWTGGCDPSELDFSTMESKNVPGLHVIGDMVSMCRPCGGYSLWFCWTSALAASKKIAYTE